MGSKAIWLCAVFLAGVTAAGAVCPSNAILKKDFYVERPDDSWYLGVANTKSLEDSCDDCIAIPGCNFILYCNGSYPG